MVSTFLPIGSAEPGVQPPRVAGIFYPSNPEVLSAAIEDYLSRAPVESLPNLRALVCPHAGYPYSGPVAAMAYKQVIGRDFDTVIVMGPSHYALFSSAALPDAEAYRTPLGLLKFSPEARKIGHLHPFAVDPPCRVERPPWGKGAVPKETPFTWEHSVEVQLPFLQKTLPHAQLVPILCGDVDPREAARVLTQHMDDRTLLVASSDLSHFHSYAQAKILDASCVKAICNLDVDRMQREEACGKTPVTILMHIAKLKGWTAKLLDLRSSGDTGTGKDSVVGYAAIAFFQAPQAARTSPEQQQFLLDLARKTIQAAACGGELPHTGAVHVPEPLRTVRACFVTLTKHGDLRGCVGHILPRESLYRAVIDNARAAALNDSRFPSLTEAEVQDVRIEISILTDPQPLTFSSPKELLGKLQAHRDGVILRMGDHYATYLPQVWEQIPRKESFLSELSLKAGGPANLWKRPGVEVFIYQVEAFKER